MCIDVWKWLISYKKATCRLMGCSEMIGAPNVIGALKREVPSEVVVAVAVMLRPA